MRCAVPGPRGKANHGAIHAVSLGGAKPATYKSDTNHEWQAPLANRSNLSVSGLRMSTTCNRYSPRDRSERKLGAVPNAWNACFLLRMGGPARRSIPRAHSKYNQGVAYACLENMGCRDHPKREAARPFFRSARLARVDLANPKVPRAEISINPGTCFPTAKRSRSHARRLIRFE